MEKSHERDHDKENDWGHMTEPNPLEDGKSSESSQKFWFLMEHGDTKNFLQNLACTTLYELKAK